MVVVVLLLGQLPLRIKQWRAAVVPAKAAGSDKIKSLGREGDCCRTPQPEVTVGALSGVAICF